MRHWYFHICIFISQGAWRFGYWKFISLYSAIILIRIVLYNLVLIFFEMDLQLCVAMNTNAVAYMQHDIRYMVRLQMNLGFDFTFYSLV